MPGDMKHRMQSPHKKPMSGFLWLFAGLSIGLFVALLVYLGKQPKAPVSFSDAVNQEVKKAQQLAEKKKEQNDNPDKTFPKFDFYTILKEHEVFIPDSEINSQKKSADADTDNTQKIPQKRYMLQVGSFKQHTDADRRKANLALLGITSTIQEVVIDNDTWHRVRVGPINDTRQLNKIRDSLIDNDIPSMIMVLKD